MKSKKKVLLLGGSRQQIPAILKAKELGYHTITCDYLPKNPGHVYADEFYNVSTIDLVAVTSLAKQLKVDGIVCYASDPSAQTAAYASEKLGLATNPYKSVSILTNKDLFREFLASHNFNTPFAKSYSSAKEACDEIHLFQFPIMVKPVDSSGSKGVSLLKTKEGLVEKIGIALSYSRSRRVILEEYVNSPGYQVAGDGFSVDGELVFRCFGNDHFSKDSINPFVPISASFPYYKPDYIHEKIHNEIQRLLRLLDMKTGAYNFDIRVDEKEKVYLMEVGPRNGGNYIPQVIELATGVDMVEYTIKAALGDEVPISHKKVSGFYSYFAVHGNKSGKLSAIYIDNEVEKNNIIQRYMNFQLGEHVPAYTGSNGTLGIFIMRFQTMEEMLHRMDHSDEWIKVIVDE